MVDLFGTSMSVFSTPASGGNRRDRCAEGLRFVGMVDLFGSSMSVFSTPASGGNRPTRPLHRGTTLRWDG